jgi:ABC-2 type transport system ATP-binding protein
MLEGRWSIYHFISSDTHGSWKKIQVQPRQMALTIQTEQLTKKFGSVHAVDNLSLSVEQGEIYGFLGLNGAGKTTTIRMLLSMIRPTSGKVFLFGKGPEAGSELWHNVGYVVESANAYPELNVEENLVVFAHYRSLQFADVEHIIDRLHLSRHRQTKAKNLSMGNQQRLTLAKALIHRPKLLLLDEPINGLDPAGIVEVRELLHDLALQGSTILLSSHILSEIARTVSRIGIIHNGRLVREVTIRALEDQLRKRVVIDTDNNAAAVAKLVDRGFRAQLTTEKQVELALNETSVNTPEVSRILVSEGLPPREIYLDVENLEDYFLRQINAT